MLFLVKANLHKQVAHITSRVGIQEFVRRGLSDKASATKMSR